MNRYVWQQRGQGLTKVPAGTFWLSHPGRITYDSVTFKPNEPEVLPGNYANPIQVCGATSMVSAGGDAGSPSMRRKKVCRAGTTIRNMSGPISMPPTTTVASGRWT